MNMSIFNGYFDITRGYPNILQLSTSKKHIAESPRAGQFNVNDNKESGHGAIVDVDFLTAGLVGVPVNCSYGPLLSISTEPTPFISIYRIYNPTYNQL